MNEGEGPDSAITDAALQFGSSPCLLRSESKNHDFSTQSHYDEAIQAQS